jgi:hypothetical protein
MESDPTAAGWKFLLTNAAMNFKILNFIITYIFINNKEGELSN